MDDTMMCKAVLVPTALVQSCAVMAQGRGVRGAMDSPEKPAQNNATTNLGLWSISAEMFYSQRHLQMC